MAIVNKENLEILFVNCNTGKFDIKEAREAERKISLIEDDFESLVHITGDLAAAMTKLQVFNFLDGDLFESLNDMCDNNAMFRTEGLPSFLIAEWKNICDQYAKVMDIRTMLAALIKEKEKKFADEQAKQTLSGAQREQA